MRSEGIVSFFGGVFADGIAIRAPKGFCKKMGDGPDRGQVNGAGPTYLGAP